MHDVGPITDTTNNPCLRKLCNKVPLTVLNSGANYPSSSTPVRIHQLPPQRTLRSDEIRSLTDIEESTATKRMAMLYDSASQQRILETGSFSGFHRVAGLASHGYLTQAKDGHQAFCGNEEGWGPFSEYRYDLTPCALDTTIAAVAAYGIVFGAGAIYYLMRWKKAQEVKRDLHFWAKE